MTEQQLAALEALAGRPLIKGEAETFDKLREAGDFAGIAAALSLRADGKPRMRVRQPTFVGDGLLSDALGLPFGPVFVLQLEQLAAAGLPAEHTQEQLAVYAQIRQAWRLLAEGKLDVGLQSVRDGIDALVQYLPGATADMAARIKALAEVPDPVSVHALISEVDWSA